MFQDESNLHRFHIFKLNQKLFKIKCKIFDLRQTQNDFLYSMEGVVSNKRVTVCSSSTSKIMEIRA